MEKVCLIKICNHYSIKWWPNSYEISRHRDEKPFDEYTGSLGELSTFAGFTLNFFSEWNVFRKEKEEFYLGETTMSSFAEMPDLLITSQHDQQSQPWLDVSHCLWPTDSAEVQPNPNSSPCLSVLPLPNLLLCLCAHRDASRVKHLEEKLSAARRLLAQQKAQELSIQKEHRKADTHKKMTEFWAQTLGG